MPISVFAPTNSDPNISTPGALESARQDASELHFFFKKKNFQKKTSKKCFFLKKKFFSEFFYKKKIFFFCHSRPIFFGFFFKKKIQKKKVEFSIELAGAQEDANWRGGVFLFRWRGGIKFLHCRRRRKRTLPPATRPSARSASSPVTPPGRETCCIRRTARFSVSIHSETRHQRMRKTKSARPCKHRCSKQMSTHVLHPEGATVSMSDGPAGSGWGASISDESLEAKCISVCWGRATVLFKVWPRRGDLFWYQDFSGDQHLPAPVHQEQMQGVRGREHLPAPAPKKPMQGVREGEHLPVPPPPVACRVQVTGGGDEEVGASA